MQARARMKVLGTEKRRGMYCTELGLTWFGVPSDRLWRGMQAAVQQQHTSLPRLTAQPYVSLPGLSPGSEWRHLWPWPLPLGTLSFKPGRHLPGDFQTHRRATIDVLAYGSQNIQLLSEGHISRL